MNFVAKTFGELTKEELYEILKARCEIFVVEQGMRCQDMDDMDQVSKHFILKENDKLLAYLRAFYDESEKAVKIGRVLSITHKKGLGTMLLDFAVSEIRKNEPDTKIYVNSQKQASGFYEKMGFKAVSDEFLEEGVLHIKMELQK